MNDLSNEPIQPSGSPSSDNGGSKPSWLTRKEYTDAAEKRKDFWIGVVLFFVLNIALVLCQWGLGFGAMTVAPNGLGSDDFSTTLTTIVSWIFILLPWVINIGLIVFFAFTRSQIALGMVAGFGIALAIVICLGIVFTIWCFIALGSMN
ncbi:MAG: hypothetical protein DCC56_10950 [Anaerolineae bacterium]|nr:MAG: hypothetical protein DCC56_10950 [Anaerolineae bacterium]WKZ45700.1 MAG: hypothetical protein QY302_07895 [Anaerolineales bacterium]